jgi:hypothetical protein
MERNDRSEVEQGLHLSDKIGLGMFLTAFAVSAVIAGYSKCTRGEFFPEPAPIDSKVSPGICDRVKDVLSETRRGEWEIKPLGIGDWEVIEQPEQ